MKRILLSTITLFIGVVASAQVPVIYYDFEINEDRLSGETVVEQTVNTGISAIARVSKVGGTLAQAAGAGQALYGGVPGKGIITDSWPSTKTDPGTAASEYLEVTINTSGLSSLSLSFDHEKTNGQAPDRIGVIWSSNGTTFFPASTAPQLTSGSWSTLNFSLPAGAENQAKLIIRIYAYAAGNSMIAGFYMDNLTLHATTISGVKTLLDYTAYGTSLASGKKYKPLFSDLVISGAGTIVYLNSWLPYSGTVNVHSGATLSVGTRGVMSDTTSVSSTSKVAVGNLVLEDGSTLQLSSTDSKSALKSSIGISILKLNPNANIEYIGHAIQHQDAASLSNVIVSNPSGVVHSGDVVINGNLTLKNGTMKPGANKLFIKGNISKTNGAIDATDAEVILDGTQVQTIANNAFAGPVKRLTINNANGINFDTDATIAEAVTLTNGKFGIGNKKLTISGSINRNGSTETGAIDAANGSLELNGVAEQIVPTGTFANNKVKNLRISNIHANGVSLHAKVDLTSTLDFGAVNNAKLKSNGNLTLKSDANGTARVGDLTNGGLNAGNNVEGNITVERWFPNNGRKYRFITAGVNTTTSIKANWMEGGMNTSFCSTCNNNPAPGYGTHITGTGGNTNGFDVTRSNAASLFTFDPLKQNWVAVTSTAGTLNASTPYLIFIRGDRSVDMTASGSVPVLLPGTGTTLRATGTLPSGTKNVTAPATAGKTTLVSNPYPSPISWASIYANNSDKFENYYTYWEPKVGQRGAYVTVTNTGLTNNPSSTATVDIQSGQAFMVTTKAGVTAPTLIVREQDKSATSNVNVFRAQRVQANPEKLYISLNFTVANGEKFNADAVMVAYGETFSNNVDVNDALQAENWDEDVAIVRDGKALSIETRLQSNQNDTLPLSIARLKAGQSYEWQFTPADMTVNTKTVYLVDNFLKQQTMLNLSENTTVPFTVTSDPASTATDRFMVVTKAAGQTLPLSFTKVKAYQLENAANVQVEWNTADESEIKGYEVEKSTDGQQFEKMASAEAKRGAINSYSIKDNTTSEINYYRIKMLAISKEEKYSNVVVVRIAKATAGSVTIYPNPVKGKTATLQLQGLKKGSYTATIYNNAGVQVQAFSLQNTGGAFAETIQLNESLAKGSYVIRINGEGTEKQLLFIKD